MDAPTYALTIVKGKTLNQVLLYAEPLLRYLPIEAVVSTAPLRLQVTGHGLPSGWPVRIQGVTAPSLMNTAPETTVQSYVIDANTIEINSLDASTWGAFTVSGNVVCNTPADISGWKFRMQVRDAIGGTVLLRLSSDVADGAEGVITILADNSSFALQLTAVQTAALEWPGAVYDIEAVRPDGSVIGIISPSPVIVRPEVTVWL